MYHVLHVQSRPLATSIVASAAAAEFAYENTEAIGKEMVHLECPGVLQQQISPTIILPVLHGVPFMMCP